MYCCVKRRNPKKKPVKQALVEEEVNDSERTADVSKNTPQL
jgi:hypothetical protein